MLHFFFRVGLLSISIEYSLGAIRNSGMCQTEAKTKKNASSFKEYYNVSGFANFGSCFAQSAAHFVWPIIRIGFFCMVIFRASFEIADSHIWFHIYTSIIKTSININPWIIILKFLCGLCKTAGFFFMSPSPLAIVGERFYRETSRHSTEHYDISRGNI